MVKRLIPFIFSGVLGLAAVVMLQRYLGQERAKLAAQQRKLQAMFQDQVSVIVATKDIAEGATITPELLGSQLVPSKFAQPYATSRGMDVLGWIAKAPIAQGEQILTNKLRRETEKPPTETLSGLTPSGKRAVTIGTDALSGVGGFVRPGDKVDVLWTFKVPGGQQASGQHEGELLTVTLFQNVNALAVGGEMVGKSSSEHETGHEAAPVQSNTVTLALSPQEAALLLYAREQGQIQLSLRPVADKDELVAVPPANMETLTELILGKNAMGQAAKPQRSVEVFKGLERTVVAVNE